MTKTNNLEEKDTYALRGVDSSKKAVHSAIKRLDPGIIPNCFVNISPDIAGDENYGTIMHMDGIGTKIICAIQDFLYQKKKGGSSALAFAMQDAIVMNLDDILCAGAGDEIIYFTCAINRNSSIVTDEMLAEFIQGGENFTAKMREIGIDIHYVAGETADCGDTVRTMTVDISMTTRIKRNNIITFDALEEGDIIIGLSSCGITSYELEENSGLRSNGLTDARHDLLAQKSLQHVGEMFNPAIDNELVYRGPYEMNSMLLHSSMTVGKALCSPTRTYVPVLLEIFKKIDRKNIHGITHNSGGGATKILKWLPQNIMALKDKMPVPPLLFEAIQDCSGKSYQDMYKTYNMGIGMDLYVPREVVDTVKEICQTFNLNAYEIGRLIKKKDPKDSDLLILDPKLGVLQYYKK